MDTLPPRSLVLILGAFLLWGFLTAFAREASIAINDKKLAQLAENNRKAARLHQYLEKDSSGLVGVMELLEYALACLFSVILVLGFAGKTVAQFQTWGLDSVFGANSLVILIFTLIVVFFYLVFWKQLPERFAAKFADAAAVFFASYSILVAKIGKPFLWIPTLVSNVIARIFGINPHDLEEEITEEEIRMLVDIGSESGAIDDDEKEMIHNIFEMDDKPVKDIMTHRTEVCLLWKEDSLEDWKQYIDETAHTRYPVCDDEIDNVVGTVNSRDFYRFLLNGGKREELESIFRKPHFVPESMKADELFSRMQEENTHMVVVMDEYGGFQGVVTQKDLLEEIVGELYSEDEEPELEQDITLIGENTWKIRGSAEIDDVEKELDIEIPEGDYNTFAGLILDAIETLPEDGETVETEIENMQIRVTSVAEHRIEEAVVCLKEIKEQTEEE